MTVNSIVWLRKCARWLGAALVFVVVLELCARVEDYIRWGAPIGEVYSHGRLFARDSIGIHNRANYRYTKWAINAHGFRGAEIDPSKRAGTTRIAVLGASETFGLFEREGKEYPAQLQEMLRSRAPHAYEVINSAVPGMSLPAVRVHYQKRVARFSPDIVVVYPSPTFYLNEQPPAEQPRGLGPGPMPANVFKPRLPTKAEEALRRFIPLEIQTAMYGALLAQKRRVLEPDDVWTEIPPERVELYRRHLTALVEAIHASGATAVLMTHATRYDGAFDERSTEDRYHLAGVRNLFPRASDEALLTVSRTTNAILRQVAAEQGAVLLDLASRIPRSGTYFADFSHFTDTGASFVARELAEALPVLAPLPHAGAGDSRIAGRRSITGGQPTS